MSKLRLVPFMRVALATLSLSPVLLLLCVSTPLVAVGAVSLRLLLGPAFSGRVILSLGIRGATLVILPALILLAPILFLLAFEKLALLLLLLLVGLVGLPAPVVLRLLRGPTPLLLGLLCLVALLLLIAIIHDWVPFGPRRVDACADMTKTC